MYVRTREALARSESWMDHKVDVVLARSVGQAKSVETVPVKIVDYQSAAGTFQLAAVPVQDTGYTYLVQNHRFSMEGRETFYVVVADDLLMCAVGPGFVYIVPSFGRIRIPQEGISAAIAHFAQTADDAHLLKVEAMELTVNLRDAVGSPKMWNQGAHAANPIILAKSVEDSVVRLDLESPTGGMWRSVWIDLKTGKLLKFEAFRKGGN